jgi:hypothetical protein
MTREPNTIDRRTYLQATGAAALGTTAMAGCMGEATGTLATKVSDQPSDIDDFESLVVEIVGFWLGPAGEEDGTEMEGTETEGTETGGTETEDGDAEGRQYFEFDEAQQADLVKLQGEKTQLVDERELEVGEYGYLQLDVVGVDATLKDGGEPTVETPGEAPITFNEPFEVREDTRTSFTADFTPVKRGQTGTYVIQPVPDEIEVTYGSEETTETTEA